MKTFKIEYHLIQSNHILAIPEFSSEEFVNVDSEEKLQEYIESQKDSYGNSYTKNESFGFQYISHAGGVKVREYKKPLIKTL